MCGMHEYWKEAERRLDELMSLLPMEQSPEEFLGDAPYEKLSSYSLPDNFTDDRARSLLESFTTMGEREFDSVFHGWQNARKKA